ncbi:divalent-cation tolerance protein CutA [Piscinibacter sakaiensis]|uniref:divalent-cation tolerance protein CutA n=1 Tax=Piscinibacter sakaiensis TaxID=1547922 RepID=UPI00372CB478
MVTTVASHEDGRRLAQALVGRRLAACAQLEAIESVYVWDGRLEQAPECRVLFKTTGARAAALEAGIRALHGYVQPAIHAWPVVQADPGFAQWVEAAVVKLCSTVTSWPDRISSGGVRPRGARRAQSGWRASRRCSSFTCISAALP